MAWFAVKVILSAFLIVLISEVSKRSSLLGAVFASVPLVSVLALLWLWADTGSPEKVSLLCRSVFWLVLPSLPFFLLFPFLLHRQVNFYLGLCLSLAATAGLYLGMLAVLPRCGVRL